MIAILVAMMAITGHWPFLCIQQTTSGQQSDFAFAFLVFPVSISRLSPTYFLEDEVLLAMIWRCRFGGTIRRPWYSRAKDILARARAEDFNLTAATSSRFLARAAASGV